MKLSRAQEEIKTLLSAVPLNGLGDTVWKVNEQILFSNLKELKKNGLKMPIAYAPYKSGVTLCFDLQEGQFIIFVETKDPKTVFEKVGKEIYGAE